ncbi:MAG: hypothetical protein Cpurp_07310 [Chlorogloea purpurea SAG 13.99]|nr:hypothetical protein [Chlorogloea purpurea SAG 13.99]
MAQDDTDREIRGNIAIDFAHPRILDGLEYWRVLGLIDDQEIKFLSKKYLSCAVLEMVTAKPTVITNTSFAEEIIPEPVPVVTENINLFNKLWQSFRAELSVRWLLFLGLFLVIVSSTLLAGTQWNNISNLGQYAILWGYTLIFFIVGSWARKQINLQLTAQTLQVVFTLLIPINIWAIDTFSIGRSTPGIIGAVSAITVLFYLYYRKAYNEENGTLAVTDLLFLLLSLLHLRWGTNSVSLSAVYIGSIGVASVLVFGRNNRHLTAQFSTRLAIYALATLLLRIIFIRQLSLWQIGLPLGVMGWLTPYYYEIENREGENTFLKNLFDRVAIGLLGLAWLITLDNYWSWQSVGVSLLVLHFFYRRLRANWRSINIIALFLFGLQSLFRWRDLLPPGWRESAVTLWLNTTGSTGYFPNLYGVTLFPYVIIWVIFSRWLRRQDKKALAQLAQYLSFALGIVLTLISLTNVWGRSFNLLLSTVTLIYVISSGSRAKFLIRVGHAVGLLTVASFIDAIYPSLNNFSWALITLAFTVMELLLSIRRSDRPLWQSFYDSAWFFGCLLAGVSYALFFWVTQNLNVESLWWLLTPATFTLVGVLGEDNRKSQGITISCYALIVAIALTLWQSPVRLMSFGISSVVMATNSYYLPRLLTTRSHIGFVLATGLLGVWEYGFKSPPLWTLYVDGNWLLFQCLLVGVLWLVSLPLRGRENSFLSLTGKACYEWGILFFIWNTLRLTLHSVASVLTITNTSWQWWLSPVLLAAVLLYTHRSRLDNLVVWGAVWLGEVFIVETLWHLRESFLLLAVVNLIVGWLAFFLTRKLATRYDHLVSIKFFPLFYGGVGILWRLGQFNAYTGGLTVVAALLGLAVSRRFERGNSLAILSLVGVSLGIYEEVFYAASRSSDRNLANFFLLLSVVSVVIAIIHRLLLRRYVSLLYLTVNQGKAIAHTYWLISLPLKLGGMVSLYPSPYLLFLSLLTSLYSWREGFISGKDKWVYWGGMDFFVTIVILRLTYPGLGSYDWLYGLVGAVFSFCIYNLPWQTWGWRVNPWQRMALFLPLVTALFTFGSISYPSLAFIALFYAYVSMESDKIRWSYASLVFFNWMLAKFLIDNDFGDVFYWGSMLGLSILYISTVDPILKGRRQQRHNWRVAGSGLICVTALLFHQETGGLIPASISLLTLLVGLGFRVRAFLFVGTITFMLTVFYQLILLSWSYSFLKWAIGLLIGIIMISVAALFERLREQVMSLWNNVLQQLQSWE